MVKNYIFRFALLSVLVGTYACAERDARPVTTESMTASGEFLFEGPNTLQGNFLLDMKSLSEEIGVDPEQISAVNIEAITLFFENEETEGVVESILIQLVSNELPLQSAGTLSVFSGEENLLNVNKDFDILAYIKDPSSQLIVDANLKNDMDELSVSMVFQLSVKY